MADARSLLDRAERMLIDSGRVEKTWRGAERDQAETLLTFVLNRTPGASEPIPDAAERRIWRVVRRRARGEPIPYITGWKEFRGLRLKIAPGVFVPRDTSEFLAEQAVHRLKRRRAPVAVDLATGAGPVALSVKHEVPHARVFGTDLSADAVRQARANAARLKLRVDFLRGDLLGPLPATIRGTVDAITIHPPYVPPSELKLLAPEVRDYEPEHTLTDRSRDGLGLVRRLAEEGPEWLRPGGWALVELSSDLARTAKALFTRAGYSDVRSTRGEMPHNRVIAARL